MLTSLTSVSIPEHVVTTLFPAAYKKVHRGTMPTRLDKTLKRILATCQPVLLNHWDDVVPRDSNTEIFTCDTFLFTVSVHPTPTITNVFVIKELLEKRIFISRKNRWPIDLLKVRIRPNATTRFAREFPEHIRYDINLSILTLLGKAQEKNAISQSGVIRRLISHKEKARYFKFGSIRFVVTEKPNGFELVTVEKDMGFK